MTTRRVYAAAAIITWFGVLFGLVLATFNVYPPTEVAVGALGNNAEGIAGLFGRVFDSFSYFTNLSNILVAVVFTMLAINTSRNGAMWNAIRMDSLVMITITGLIYVIVLAPDAQVEGLDIIVNTIKHYIVPVMTVVLWLILGPRKQLTFISVFTALIIPIAWAGLTLIRGAVISGYPYGFLNVVEHGLPTVLTNIVGVAVLGIVLGVVFWAVDRLITHLTASRSV
ncbi:MAG: Pr6Pr family membrane protein [Actinomycetia bacterium]|jgi:hypothetical protein|nr:Pr6Pr family membrane protein [Actinomycetes bacterium]MCH9839840.1 Pr6Pr family membrane protein [Actinomycetes bacterium]